jgi:hypothetical protein
VLCHTHQLFVDSVSSTIASALPAIPPGPIMRAHTLQSRSQKLQQCGSSRAFSTTRPRTVSCHATQQQSLGQHKLSSEQLASRDRRDILLQLGSFTAAAFMGGLSSPAVLPAAAGELPEVGTYLPPSGIDDLVLFQPDPRKTPALRAGTVDPSSPYKFAIPPKFRYSTHVHAAVRCCSQDALNAVQLCAAGSYFAARTYPAHCVPYAM